ncbi:MAG TPA: GNAT family N-acetyltransferase, partial [Acidimicrobiales bacterium]|nr:GNAT family N-acetyltransferase [Acidimicrobiales bacterium]
AGDDLARWAATKVRAFAETDDEPAPEAVARELRVRRREWSGIELWLATLAGEPAAVLARYVGDDEVVFNLATRAPYRHRGVAQALLARWAAQGAGCRSLVINADDPGRPAELYWRLGFTDEVFWHRRYECGAPPPAGG